MKRRAARKILSWALILTMFLSVLPTEAFALEDPFVGETDTIEEVIPEQNSKEEIPENEASAAELVETEIELLANGFAGGSGTKSDPYLISAKDQLDSVRDYLDKHFKLNADIEFTDADFAEGGAFYNDGAGWMPIGDESAKFTGTFDGDGHVIAGLTQKISTDTNAYGGLFGYADGATVKNLGAVDFDISGSGSSNIYAGSIVGYISSGNISDCYNTGTVDAKSTFTAYAGGLVGAAEKSTFSGCYNEGVVSAVSVRSSSNLYTYAGGIVGEAINSSSISDCFNTGTVNASAPSCITAFPSAGGVAGDVSGSINNCYNTGTVVATVSASSSFSSADAGGLAGSVSGNINDCYNTGSVRASVTAGSSSAEAAADAGGIAGSISNGNVSRCDNTGAVSASTPASYSASSATRYANAGGIVGTLYNWNSGTITISECCNSGKVSNSSSKLYTGGIVGETYAPSGNINITKCCNAGAVSASTNTQSFTGGIAGYHSKGAISDCYSTGNIDGGYAGGIAGYVKSGSSVSNCYNAGEMKYCSYKGGIAGAMYGTGSNCYYLNSCVQGSGSGFDSGTIRCTDAQMQQQATFTGFDFSNTWQMGDGVDYLLPTLRAVAHPVTAFAGGRGTAESPYLVSDTTQLNSVRKYPDAHFRMTKDIEFSDADFAEGGAFYNNDAGWQPIGDESAPFTGTFDGDGHIIKGLRLNSSAEGTSYHGLFGYAKKATLKNIGMVDSDIYVAATGENYPCVGGVVGYTVSGTVTNCYHAGSITVSSTDYAFVGGIVGQAYANPPYTTIEGCYNIGTISVTRADDMGCVGGIAGKAARISRCYNAGSISMNSTNDFYTYVGGIVGEGSVVENCYNTGEVSAICLGGCIFVGGIAGEFSTISGVYNTGNVSATYSATPVNFCVGAIAGTTYNESSTITNAYYLDNCENGLGFGNVNSIYSACIPCTMEQLKEKETFSGFDFADTWTMAGNEDYLFPELIGVEMVFTKKAESMIIASLPTKLEYSEGMPLDLSGGKVAIYYNNGASEEIAISADMISGYESGTLGVQTITVTYCGFSATFDITVREKKLASIEVTTLPDKLKYIRGEEELDLTGSVLTLNYDNGTTTELALTADMTGTIDHSYAGEQVIAVLYENQFAFFSVTVVDRTAIAVTALPMKTTYLEGETLDLTGGELMVNYSDGSYDVIEMEHAMLSYDKNAIGDVGVTVNYGGFTDSFTVKMVAKSATSIAVTAPVKTSYLEGKDILDVAGGKVAVYYNNGTSDEIDLTPEMVSGFDNTVVGIQTLTVNYGGFTDSFTVTVVAKSLSSITVTTLPENLVFVEGTALSVTGGSITAYYDNGTSEEVDLSVDMVSGFDSAVLGEQMLTVSYSGKTTEYMVTIIAKTATSIAVTTLPQRLSYIAGRIPLDVTGGKVTVYYDNGTSEEIDLTLEMVSGFDNTVIGTQMLTVSCGELETSYEITINAMVVQSIELTAPTKIEYLQGAALDLTGGSLIVVYVSEDNYTEEIPLTDNMISNYDPEKVGVQTVFVTYEGKRAVFAVRVIAKSMTRIELTAPEKLNYIEGAEMLDVTGGKVTAYYNNGTSEEIDLTLEMVSGFDNTVIGRQMLSVSYKGFTDTFEVEIIHDEIAHEAQAPTCTENGWEAYVTCSRCDYTTYEEKAKLGHDEVAHEAQAPTCTENGWEAYVTCSRCDYNTYVELPELGHGYADVVFEWANDFSAVTATRVCHCGHEENAACTLEWTTYADGKLSVIATAELGEDVFSAQKEIIVSEQDGVITVVLPDTIPGLKVLAATYAVNGQMTATVPAEIRDNTILLFAESTGVRIFILTADYRPITPVIVF